MPPRLIGCLVPRFIPPAPDPVLFWVTRALLSLSSSLEEAIRGFLLCFVGWGGSESELDVSPFVTGVDENTDEDFEKTCPVGIAPAACLANGDDSFGLLR